jgi:carbon storage regulator
MLVLSRRVGEKILIGDSVAVTIVRIAPGIVRVGVEAPPEMPIVREELKEQMKEEAQPKTAAQP